MEALTLVLLAGAAFFAGFVDSIVGGGGVITLPALLAAGVPPHLALGTNKLAATGASSVSTWQYARAGLLVPRLAWSMAPLSLAAAVLGATTVLQVPGRFITAAVAALVAVMTAYVLVRPHFGRHDGYTGLRPTTLAATALLAASVGFYDGFLGPGTGNLLLFGLIAIHGFGFLPAAAHGRVLNLASNLGALALFAWADTVDYAVGGVMAIGTVSGGFTGARFGIRHGARWIRPLFVVAALALFVRLLIG